MTCTNVHLNAELGRLIDVTLFYGCRLTREPTAYAYMDCFAIDGCETRRAKMVWSSDLRTSRIWLLP